MEYSPQNQGKPQYFIQKNKNLLCRKAWATTRQTGIFVLIYVWRQFKQNVGVQNQIA